MVQLAFVRSRELVPGRRGTGTFSTLRVERSISFREHLTRNFEGDPPLRLAHGTAKTSWPVAVNLVPGSWEGRRTSFKYGRSAGSRLSALEVGAGPLAS
jgi:hypothetical protein